MPSPGSWGPYVSSNASPFTDALARSGLAAFRGGFWAAWERERADAAAGYSRIADASLLPGITLGQAGLGSVHGLASPLGPFSHPPRCGVCYAGGGGHGGRHPGADGARAHLACAGKVRAGVGAARPASLAQRDETLGALVELLRSPLGRLELPRLGACGMGPADLHRVVGNCRGGSMRTKPLVLTDAELGASLEARIQGPVRLGCPQQDGLSRTGSRDQ